MYAIGIKDYDDYGNSALALWVTRCGDTDNYSYEITDATLFATKSAARALIATLKLDEDHEIIKI